MAQRARRRDLSGCACGPCAEFGRRDRARVKGGEGMRLFVDMDGVLADFDTGHEVAFGVRADKLADNVDWARVRSVTDFYLNLPPMPDMPELWAHIEPYRPIVLTGVPHSVAEAPENKRAWARKHLGAHVEVRCCRSRESSRTACAARPT